MVWHVAAARGHIEVLGRFWSWAENLNDNFLLFEHRDGNFAWHLKVKRGNIQVSRNLLGWTEATQIQGDDVRNAVFLALYKCEKLPGNWHKDI
jgi:predicted lipid carrier protein YhbT